MIACTDNTCTARACCLLERHLFYNRYRQHCDAAGAIEALTLLDKYIAPGCVLLFDDLINYPGYREHEILALWEWLEETGRKLEVRHLALHAGSAQSHPGSSVRRCTGVSVEHLACTVRCLANRAQKHFACIHMRLTVAVGSLGSSACSQYKMQSMAHQHNCRGTRTVTHWLQDAMLPDCHAQQLFCKLA